VCIGLYLAYLCLLFCHTFPQKRFPLTINRALELFREFSFGQIKLEAISGKLVVFVIAVPQKQNTIRGGVTVLSTEELL